MSPKKANLKRKTGRIWGSVWWKELSDSGIADHRTDSQNLFHFYLCNSEEELKNQVILGEAECGYVIPEDLGERLREKRIKRCYDAVYISIHSHRSYFCGNGICGFVKTV